MTGLAERYIFLIRLTALKTHNDLKGQGVEYKKEDIVAEAAMATNLMLTHGNQTPVQAVLGYTPRSYYDIESETIDADAGQLETCPDDGERAVRCRLAAKRNIMQSIVELRLSRATTSRPEQGDVLALKLGDQVDIFRSPDRKDLSGWRGPCELV